MLQLRSDGILPFQTQLSLMLFPLLLLPVFVLGYFSYHVSYDALQTRTLNNADSITTLINQSIDNRLKQVIQLAEMPLYSAQVQQITTYYAQHPEIRTPGFQDTQAMTTFFLNIVVPDNDVVSIDVLTTGNVSFSQTFDSGIMTPSDWKTQPWFIAATQTDRRTMILPPGTIPPEMYLFPGHTPSVVSIVQTIVNVDTFQPVGVIVVNLDSRVLEQIIQSSQTSTDTQFLIYNDQSQPILVYPIQPATSSHTQKLLTSMRQAVQQAGRQFTWQNTNYFISHSTSSLSNWTVVALVPTSSLLNDVESIKQTTILVICVILCFVTVLFLYLINGVSRNVTQLRRLMRQVETGNLDVRFRGQGRGEIIRLGHSFNVMASRLKQLIQDNYEIQLQRQQAELSALQSQINPHFLYNTLSSFQMIALKEGNERIAEMSYTLGQLMRYALGTEDIVEVAQEIEHVRNFLLLIKQRYKERLHYEIQVSEEVYTCKIPKFTLQPLVENAIYHGIDPKVGTGSISLHGFQQEGVLVLEIVDDGIGMTWNTLTQVQSALQYETNVFKRSQHIGICNIQGRLQRIFGPEYGLSCTSHEGQGTCITLCIPVEECLKEENYEPGTCNGRDKADVTPTLLNTLRPDS